jgi:multidrug efflux pump subunit AcrA (membrane-fusion protein)
MKKNLKNNSIILAIVALLTLASCGAGGNHVEHADTYTCPMHPTVVSDRPSTCPVCGMDLVRKARSGEEVEITEDLAKLIQSPNETVIASIKTIKAEYKSVPSSVEAQGVVTYDTRNIFTIPSRVGGRLEKIYLKYAFQPVAKGQKIAEIYSPELLTAQRELLFLVESDAENKSLIDAAKNKLELLGLTSAQIDNLIARKTATQTFSIYSPHAGYLITGQQAPTTSISISPASTPDSGGMSDRMGSSPSGSSAGTSTVSLDQNRSIIREGAYVSAGETLFSIVHTGDLRIELDLPAPQAGAIKKGDKLSLDFGNGLIEETTIAFVQPFFSEGQDFVKLRVFTNKTKDLHIGHLVSAKIQLPASESLWVPREAVLDLGTDKIVFLKERGVLKPQKVAIGISSEGLVEIRSGLASSDEIAANAHYLVDSESFIKTEK